MEKDTRTKLIELATELFATKGFSAVSVRDLTSTVGVNVSAISYYFESKERLYQIILKEQLAPFMEALETVKGNESLTPIKRLTSYADQIAKVHMQRPYLARFMISEVTNPTDYGGSIVKKHISQVFEFMAEAIREGMANGDLRADLNVAYTALSLSGMINFYFITRPMNEKIISPAENSPDAYIAHTFRAYLHGIADPIKWSDI
jgi:TetR/AcrR family transcriptional regulator